VCAVRFSAIALLSTLLLGLLWLSALSLRAARRFAFHAIGCIVPLFCSNGITALHELIKLVYAGI
jgi:hypothetical protein